jgi:hypothetical protein
MLRRVALAITDVSEELRASFIRVTSIGELGTRLAVTSNRRKLGRNISGLELEILVFLEIEVKSKRGSSPLFFFKLAEIST